MSTSSLLRSLLLASSLLALPAFADEPPPASSETPDAGFGLRFGWGAIPVPTTAPGIGTVGLRIPATSSIALNVDVGMGMNFGGGGAAAFGFILGVSGDIYLRSGKFRPLINIGTGFAKTVNNTGDGFTTGLQFGGGAEYFIDPRLSLTGKALLGIPVQFGNPLSVGIATFSPGLGATLYF
jgi:hypothetical protein